MSALSSIDAYDAQMLDFSSDPDVPMNITASAEFFAEALMDHDDHLATSAYTEHASVEVDMEEYVGDNAEYEMADETAEYRRDELLDVEVYDASHVPSPLVLSHSLQPSADVAIVSEHSESTPPVFSEHAVPSEAPQKPKASLDHSVADASHVEPAALVVSSESVTELVHLAEAPDETILASESSEQLGETASTNGQTYETPAPVDADEGQPHIPSVSEEHPADSEATQHETSEPLTAGSASLAGAEDVLDGVSLAQVEKAAEQVPVSEGETVDPLLISDGVYIDPPPAVLLSVSDLSEPDFTLFNQPEAESEFTDETRGGQKVYSLLLQSRPTLYYEPLTSVFAALRQDEGLLSRVSHSFEGELVLDAYDLQLAISEDNLHSREISLHDLNILHDGSDFAGPLRLLLRATVPRFIMRYYTLQDQIQRLNLAAETGEEEHTEEHHEHYDAGEEHLHLQQDEAAVQTTIHARGLSEDSEASSTAEAEEQPAKEPEVYPEPSKEYLHDNNQPEDVSGVQEPAAEYHEVAGEATRTLEDEDDYEGTNAGDEDESTKSESLDADQIHDIVAEDTDAPATVTGHESDFGGEQTEYLDYVQPEEYDPRYGEDLPERAGGASPVQYGEPQHYEEEGEQDTSTAVDETQVVLPGSDEDEEDESGETPIPARAVLESESNELAADESTLVQQENPVPTSEESVGKSTNEVGGVQATGNQEPSTARAKIFSQVEESDSNFAAMLEREADAEFDRTFDADRSGQETSIEVALQHEEAWDEWDDEDAEGEDEEDWMDPDAASNESSVTLSSKGSSKRSYDEVDPSEELYVENAPSSPGSKRPRIQ